MTATHEGSPDPGVDDHPVDADPLDCRMAQRASGALRTFNRAGVLGVADVHVAMRVGRICMEDDEGVLLGAAFAVRGSRLGHVCTDLATVRSTVTIDGDLPVDLQSLPWPETEEWVARVSNSALVAVGEHPGGDRPLRLMGSRLYLDRYWREERQVADELSARAGARSPEVDAAVLASGLARLFPAPAPEDEPDYQRLAAEVAVLRRLTVVAGGPGTGKTTTVARILALLYEQADEGDRPPPLVALAAPTGKAAARLEEAVHDEAAVLDVGERIRSHLLGLRATTLHRLLGWRFANHSRFRHHRGNRLAHEVVIVDETSMVSLSLMARLVESVRSEARLVLVGDPQQLVSVEAGAVLGDVVGPAGHRLLMTPEARRSLASAAVAELPAGGPPSRSRIGDGVVVLRRVHRFGGAVAALAEAVRGGDAGAAMRVLEEGTADLRWIPVDIAGTTASEALEEVRTASVKAGRRVLEAAAAGRAKEAVDALGAFRVLCGHRHGPYGVETWIDRIERWLVSSVPPGGLAGAGQWYAGRPLLVTENDYGLRLYNGDTGVVVLDDAGRPAAVFERGGELLRFSPSRLSSVDTVYAMTVHKSQGSQFDTVAVLLPHETSPLLTRELLYTAVTRARRRLMVVGTEEALRAAVSRPIARASGLRGLLWGPDST